MPAPFPLKLEPVGRLLEPVGLVKARVAEDAAGRLVAIAWLGVIETAPRAEQQPAPEQASPLEQQYSLESGL